MPGTRRPARSLADVPYKELVEKLQTLSLRAVAAHYGCARNTARYWRSLLNIPPLLTRPPRGPALQPQLLAWLRQHPDGATTAKLVVVFEESSLVIYRALRRLEANGLVSRTLDLVPNRYQTCVRWFALPGPEGPEIP